MSWKRFWNDWDSTVIAVGVCLAAFVLYSRAWHVGYAASALGLLGCHFLRFFLLLFAGLAIISEYRHSLRINKPDVAPKPTTWDVACMVLTFTGCAGCYPVWPIIVLLLAFPLLLACFFSWKRGVGEKPAGIAIVRLCMGILLFILSWYFCSAITAQALRGLGARIEDMGSADKLLAWAADEIAVQKRDQPIRRERQELPEWIEELLGPFQGVRGAFVRVDGPDPHVMLYTGGSAYHFVIYLYPSQADRDPLPWWTGDEASKLRPGIYLGTGGK